jgi:hypothetical protein
MRPRRLRRCRPATADVYDLAHRAVFAAGRSTDVDGWSTPAVHADPEFGRAKSISDHASLEAIETEALHRRNIGQLCRQHPAVERLLAEALALRVIEAPRWL